MDSAHPTHPLPYPNFFLIKRDAKGFKVKQYKALIRCQNVAAIKKVY